MYPVAKNYFVIVKESLFRFPNRNPMFFRLVLIALIPFKFRNNLIDNHVYTALYNKRGTLSILNYFIFEVSKLNRSWGFCELNKKLLAIKRFAPAAFARRIVWSFIPPSTSILMSF